MQDDGKAGADKEVHMVDGMKEGVGLDNLLEEDLKTRIQKNIQNKSKMMDNCDTNMQ